MYDAVVFVDAAGRIALWNHGAERLTGIAGASVRQRAWSPDILDLSDEKGHSIARPIARSAWPSSPACSRCGG